MGGRVRLRGPRTPRKTCACSPCLKFHAFQRSFTFQNRVIRWEIGSARVSHHSLSGACPGHPTCPGPCSKPCQRVTRRNTRALLCPRAQTEHPRGPAPAAGLLPHPWGRAPPVTLGDGTPPGPLRAKIRVVTVPSERVRKLGTRNRHRRGAGVNRERERLRVSPSRSPAGPGAPAPRARCNGAIRGAGAPPGGGAGRERRPTDRPSVCPPAEAAAWPPEPPLWGRDGKQGRERQREGKMGLSSAQSLGPPLGAAGEIPGPHWVPLSST